MSSEPAQVWAVIAAYRRPEKLRALLASLAIEQPALAGALVVDNGGDPATASALENAPIPVRHLRPGANLGCGGGVALGLGTGLVETPASHFWQLDDDATMMPGALAALLAALRTAEADVAVPLIVNEQGRVSWFPGPLPRKGWRELGRKIITVPAFRTRFGTEPLAWVWSPWTSLLVTRRAVEAVGLPRDDYWFQGEDIEYTLRLSARFHCVLAPGAVCVHHVDAAPADWAAYSKKCAQLQNNSYTDTRLPHGRRALRHLPGNYWRFLREERGRPAALAAAAAAFWRGAVRGRPAGTPGFDGFRAAWTSHGP
jgi:rhamnopyranosyl-N-acetylglucosaminyl-diphospho-decaprenol beta-1,3/1,4-galactofuranosyltransferase